MEWRVGERVRKGKTEIFAGGGEEIEGGRERGGERERERWVGGLID